MTIDWAIVSPIVVALFGMSGMWLTAKIQHKGKPENALIDQLQEQIKDDREAKDKEIAAMKVDINDLKTEQQKSKRRELIRDNYINKLRRHIEEGKPPPAPEWPEGLYD
jgi:uncharacterized membrane protein YgaE (UPF0421/DUF939 family)